MEAYKRSSNIAQSRSDMAGDVDERSGDQQPLPGRKTNAIRVNSCAGQCPQRCRNGLSIETDFKKGSECYLRNDVCCFGRGPQRSFELSFKST